MQKARLKIFLIVAVLLILAVAGFYFAYGSRVEETAPLAVAPDPLFGWKFPPPSYLATGTGKNLFDFEFLAYSSVRDPGGIPEGLPVRLKIPAIGVNAVIEDALITPDGRMDVPYGSVNVAWFALGPHPGQVGSAVVGGHFGMSNGVKFVFYDLDKLKVGDKVYIEDDEGKTLAFQVRAIKLFERDADATPVFTSDDGLAHLNVITCEGIWNAVNNLYPLRRVVFTDAIPSEGSVTVVPYLPVTAIPAPTPTPTPTPKPTPAPAPKPTPTPTPTPVSAPTTTPAPEPTPIPTPVPEPTPTSTIPPETTASSTVLIESVKSLFGTPVDGVITAVLLIGIAFTAFKISRPR